METIIKRKQRYFPGFAWTTGKMREVKLLFFLVAVAVFGVAFTNANESAFEQRREKKEKKEQEIKQLIESGRYRFVARSVIPLSGPKVELTSLYDLKVDSNMVESWLPFFGRAYRVEYGDRDGGIKFKQEADEMVVDFNKKKKIYTINMTVKTDKDNYQIRISAGLSGYADVNVVSINRQSVSYYGTIQPIEDN